jgi:hypothetical protein
MTTNTKPTHPTSIDAIAPAATVTDAISIAEELIDECGDAEAFINVAKAAYTEGHGSGRATHDRLDEIERRGQRVWNHYVTDRRRSGAFA